ncbi:hypothetical protein [Lewinella sp. W8]|uniref:hypothetical protein n=1 Tax=Lewinella sp. W8 TaxID=2528208 RepID=UPI00106759B3|nr:hypothetical protein [Lewinella sp. W8]MTB53060.1 hypothetical protein [Lewinella sp. W8]
MEGIRKIAKAVILDELEENVHPEKVEDVIFWALDHYWQSTDPEHGKHTWGRTIARYIVDRIKEEELAYQEKNN